MTNSDYQFIILRKMLFNELKGAFEKRINTLLESRKKETEIYICSLIYGFTLDQSLSTNNISYMDDCLKCCYDSIKLIEDDEKERDRIIGSVDYSLLFENYKKETSKREQIITENIVKQFM